MTLNRRWKAISLAPLRRCNPVLFLILFCAICAPSAIGLDKKSQNGWVLNQSMVGIGDCTLYLTKDLLRMDDHTRNCTIVASGSTGRLTAYSTAKKMIHEDALAQYKGFMSYRIGGLMGSNSVKRSWIKSGDENLFGLKTTKYVPSSGGGAFRGLWTAPEIAVSKPIINFICTYFDVANFDAIPIQCVEGTNKRRVKLSTASVKKQPIANSLFTLPTGYKKVKDFEIIMFDQDAINDW